MRLKMVRPGGSLESLSSKDLAKGTVADSVWMNPHAFVKLDAKVNTGNAAHWIIRAHNRVSISQIGWSKNTFKPGDEVEIDAMLAKHCNPIGFLGSASPTDPGRRVVISGNQSQP
jgi:hypothetical protein